jgi:primosomal protein N' (replication factor Y)
MVRRHVLDVSVLGPAPCPLARLRDRWRWHVVLKGAVGPAARDLGRLVRAAARRLPRAGGVRVVIDRDPVGML